MHFGDTGVVIMSPIPNVTQILTLKMMKTMIIGQNVSRHKLYRIIYILYKSFVIIMNKRE